MRRRTRKSFVALYVFCAVVTAPLWVVPFLRELAQHPPRSWS